MPNRVLKQDLFGTVSLATDHDGRQCIERDLRGARWWARWLARHLAARERRALRHLDGMPQIPQLLAEAHDFVSRSYIVGEPMQLAGPRDPAYFRAAMRLLRQLHRHCLTHNDLAKEPNWLVTPHGLPALVDFQLARIDPRRGRLFRALGHDDLRHLLKHKRTYIPERLTARERRILARRSLPARLWMATGKPVYRFITRRIFRWADREGAGDRQLRQR